MFAPSTRYTLGLSRGVTDDAGASNGLDHRWDITTAPAPSARVAQPSDGDPAVPLDATMAVVFSRPMRPSTTVPAISLEPPVPGTRVLPSATDPSRYLILPGELLRRASSYRLTVGEGATDEHGQRLQAAVAARFTGGGLEPGDRAILLAGPDRGGASEVWLSALERLQPGDPLSTHRLLASESSRYRDATLSPDGTHLAAVEVSVPGAAARVSLRLLDLQNARTLTAVPDGDHPRWSPDSRRLAFLVAGQPRVLSTADGRIVGAAPGPDAVGPPAWDPDGHALVLPVLDSTGPRLDLVAPDVGARYPLPGVPAPASDPALSPDGRLLAARVPGPAPALVIGDLLTGGPPRQTVRRDLSPLGFIDEGTVLALRDDGDGAGASASPGGDAGRLVKVDVDSGEVTRLSGGEGIAGPPSLSTSRRHVGFLRASGSASAEAVVEGPSGTDRHLLALPPDSAPALTGLSLN